MAFSAILLLTPFLAPLVQAKNPEMSPAPMGKTHGMMQAQTRCELLQRKQDAVRASTALFSQTLSERLAREQACVQRERHLPSDA